jgi:hypothetical protein
VGQGRSHFRNDIVTGMGGKQILLDDPAGNPRLVFRLETVGPARYRFIAEIFLRVGPLAARLNKREFDAVREHMRIEGINLKGFAEGRSAQRAAHPGA